jgi:hypothetical protein
MIKAAAESCECKCVSFPTKQMSQRQRLIGRSPRRQATQAEPKNPTHEALEKLLVCDFPLNFGAKEQVNFLLVDQQHELGSAAAGKRRVFPQ